MLAIRAARHALCSHACVCRAEPLVQALEDLGYIPDHGEQPVRGYRGQTVTADLAVAIDDGGDLGFRWNSQTGAYELVTDLDLWKQNIPLERFLAKLTQRYALNTILQASDSEGFQVAEEQVVAQARRR